MRGKWKNELLGKVSFVTDFSANGSFADLRENVEYRSQPDYAILVRLIDFSRNWNGDFVYIPKRSYDFLRKCQLEVGDVVVSNIGANAGTLFRVPDLNYPCALGPNALVIKTNDFPSTSKEYLYYYLTSPVGQNQIQSIITGSAQPKFTKTDLRNLKIPFPPLPEQHAIAAILGALDEKIELNRRMNRTLEYMARAVFREWFLDNDEAKGWKVGRVGDVAQNIRRGVNSDQIEPTTGYIGLEHMPRASIALSEWGNASELVSNKFIFKQGEFLFGKLRPYFHKVGIAPIDGVCSTDILVIAPKSIEWYGFVLEHISSVELINHTNAASTGTKMPRTNWADIANFEIAIPPLELTTEFNELFLPIAEQIQVNVKQSRILASLRDTLLPKLMSGEVTIKT